MAGLRPARAPGCARVAAFPIACYLAADARWGIV
jgi:hypothetical protein